MTGKVISETTTIDAPPEVVFAILRDPRQHPRIDGSGSLRTVTSGPDRLHQGDTFRVDMKLFAVPYPITNRVVELEENRRIAWRHFGGHRWRYELLPTDDGGTQVTESFDYSRYGVVASAVVEAARFPSRNRRGITETLARLKAAAESDAQDDSPSGVEATGD